MSAPRFPSERPSSVHATVLKGVYPFPAKADCEKRTGKNPKIHANNKRLYRFIPKPPWVHLQPDVLCLAAFLQPVMA